MDASHLRTAKVERDAVGFLMRQGREQALPAGQNMCLSWFHDSLGSNNFVICDNNPKEAIPSRASCAARFPRCLRSIRAQGVHPPPAGSNAAARAAAVGGQRTGCLFLSRALPV